MQKDMRQVLNRMGRPRTGQWPSCLNTIQAKSLFRDDCRQSLRLIRNGFAKSRSSRRRMAPRSVRAHRLRETFGPEPAGYQACRNSFPKPYRTSSSSWHDRAQPSLLQPISCHVAECRVAGLEST